MRRKPQHVAIPSVLALSACLCLAAAPEDDYRDWPREYSGKQGGKLLMYQPQVISWEDHTRIEARAAVSFYTMGMLKPSLGTFRFEARTETDLATREVLIHDFEILDGHFPSTSDEVSQRLLEQLPQTFPENGLVISMDRILANLERGQAAPRETEVKVEPPRIFTSLTPAILVLVDGKPLRSPIEKTGLKFVVNTNWDLFLHLDSSTYYLLHDDAWLKAPSLGGPWSPAGKLPKGFKKLSKKDENWKKVRENVPGRKLEPSEVPVVFVSEAPAELIVAKGRLELAIIPETRLLWVTNTDSDLFLSNEDGHFYYLVSGRWFRADNLEGEWSFATTELPEDFSRIPVDHPRGRVRASVPGTPEADQAVILAQIPQKAQADRKTAAPTVSYQGEPVFEPIEGTSMYHAVNTPYDIIRVGDLYYLCFQAVWFVSTTPDGPWVMADEIPDEVYTIPPSSPVYHTTYVHVYDHSPDYVVYGYTSGYWGVYYHGGCMVYGSGWYYPPYVYWGPYYPIYYAYPVTYGTAAYYNPHTGTYGRGASVYGPYGGMGRGTAYNPHTGTYARGAAAWGPHDARGWAEAYNPSTGTYAQTRQGANSYSRWGETVVTRGDQWARTGHYTDQRGTVAGVRTSEGTGAVGYRGDEGSGFVARGENNLYAGKDGEVYRRDESGSWQKYDDDGNWNQVERPDEGARQDRGDESRFQSQDSARRDPGSRERAGGDKGLDPRGQGRDGSGTLGQLERDRRSRAEGTRQTDRSRSWRSNPSSRGSYGGSRGGRSRSRGGRRGRG